MGGIYATLSLAHICFYNFFFFFFAPPSQYCFLFYKMGFRVRLAPDLIVMLKEHPVAHQVLRQVSAFSTAGATLRAFLPSPPFCPQDRTWMPAFLI